MYRRGERGRRTKIAFVGYEPVQLAGCLSKVDMFSASLLFGGVSRIHDSFEQFKLLELGDAIKAL
jgi:hypothetical protein